MANHIWKTSVPWCNFLPFLLGLCPVFGMRMSLLISFLFPAKKPTLEQEWSSAGLFDSESVLGKSG